MYRSIPLLITLLMAALLASSGCSNNDDNNDGGGTTTNPRLDMDQVQDDGGETEEDDGTLSPDDGTGTPDASEDMNEEVDGLRIEGLSAPVSVRLDERSIPHISCATNEDCFAAQGYYHAAHRFAQMDLRRRLGRGRLSTLLTSATDDTRNIDFDTRVLLSTREGVPLEEALLERVDEETRGYLDAYTRGVNTWLEDLRQKRNGAKLSEEYGFFLIDGAPGNIPDWEPADTIACGMLFLNSLMNIASSEMSAGAAFVSYPTPFFLDVYAGWHLDPQSSIIESAGSSYTGPSAPQGLRSWPGTPPRLDALRSRIAPARDALGRASGHLGDLVTIRGEGPFGSNSWATAPERNEGEAALLSNDPHLGLTNPNVWYLATLDARTNGSGDFHATGVTFAGIPGVLIGHTPEVAWSATVAFWDLVDIYVEELSADGSGVIFNGETVPFVERTIEVGGESRTARFVPHHGPVLSIDEAARRAITLKSVLQDVDEDLALFINMGRQTTMAGAKATLATSTAAGFNFTLIDNQGTIAYYPFVAVPRREWDTSMAPSYLPIPGTGEYEWSDSYIRAAELPQLENPPNGFIATANAAISDDMLDGIPGNAGYPPLQSIFMAPGARQARIVDQITSQEGHTWQTHLALQGDTLSWMAQQILPAVLSATALTPLSDQAQSVRSALLEWNYTCPTGLQGPSPDSEPDTGSALTEAAGCAAFHAFFFTLNAAMLDDEFREAGRSGGATFEPRLIYLAIVDPSRLYTESANYFDDVSSTQVLETPESIYEAAFEGAADDLMTLFGSSMVQDWTWEVCTP